MPQSKPRALQRTVSRYTPKLPLALGGIITACGLLFLGVAHGSEVQVMIGSLVMSIPRALQRTVSRYTPKLHSETSSWAEYVARNHGLL